MKKAYLKQAAYNISVSPTLKVGDMAHLLLTMEAEIRSLIYKGECLARRVEVMSNEAYQEGSVIAWNSQVKHIEDFLHENIEE